MKNSLGKLKGFFFCSAYKYITYITYIAYVAFITFFSAAVLFSSTAQSEEGQSMHSLWSAQLRKYVINGAVDYSAWKKEERRLDEYLAMLDGTDPQSLEKTDRLAFYINAYNAYTVKLILDNFKDGRPVSSIKQLGGFFSGPWKIAFCRIGGKVYTLDNIEHDIIRPQFGDPRIHFAVNCASKSCPPLIPEAYEGGKLDEQLNKNTSSFINTAAFNYLDGTDLFVSKIFKWFAEDFNDDIVSFFKRYAAGTLKEKLEESSGSLKVKYLDYDWTLNGN